MIRRVHTVLVMSLLWMISAFAQPQSLPALAPDKNITTGTLSNGISYYFASNPSAKGLISFSLVQKMPTTTPHSDILDKAREYFSKVSFSSGSLETVLARNTCMNGDGYIRIGDGGITFDLGELSSARPEACADTLVLSLFSLARLAAEGGQPSSSQAIVIAGDFDKVQMLSKLKMLSITNPFVPGAVERAKYEWNPPEDTAMEFTVQDGPSSRIIVHWRGARTPQEYMNTVFPVISDKMSGELGWVLTSRLYPAFRAKGLYVWLDYDFMSSSDSTGDEVITLSVGCMRKYREQVYEVLKEELSRLYTWGVDEIEYTYARDAYKYRWLDRASIVRPSNSSYKERSVSAFLYGASLCSEYEKIKFAYRDLPDSSQTRFFNNYMRRMFHQNCLADSTLEKLPALVGREIVSAALKGYSPAPEIENPKGKAKNRRVKETEDKLEYVTGGVMWTFPNGVNVIYKRIETNGQIYYSYASRGGRKWADPDYFSTIDGVFEQAFSNYLSSAGIQVNLCLGATDVRLEGKVPQENIEKMLDVVSALSNQQENSKIFGPDCYKLFTIVGNIPQDKIKALMTRYVTVLGPAARWAAPTEPVISDDPVLPGNDDIRSDAQCDVIFPFEMTAANYALSDVAYYALKDALSSAFSKHASIVNVTQGFVGAPSWDYRIVLDARRADLEHFASDDEHPDDAQMLEMLRSTLKKLGESPMPVSRLNVYKNMAKTAFTSFATTPEYYIEAVNDRYLNNKDFKSKYKSWVDAVSGASLQQFYAAAASANK